MAAANAPVGHRRIWARWLGVGLAVAVVTACTAPAQSSKDETSTVEAARRTSVTTTNPDVKVTVDAATLTTAQAAATADWGDAPLAVGQPVEVTTSSQMPPEGLTITRRYVHPLPEDSAATLAYFDTTYGTWVAVESTVSADRLSVSAVVHHLSLWTDIVSFGQSAATAVQQSLSSAADWAYYAVGKVFDVRVDAPSCDAGTPAWLTSVVAVEPNRNNSILICTGIDKNAAGVAVAKARVNRGFGFNAVIPANTAWTYNSTLDPKTSDEILKALGSLDEEFARSFRELTAEALMVGPGEEFSLGLTEADVRSTTDGVALRLDPPSILPFALTTLGQLVGTDAGLKADGYVAAIMATARCARDVKDTHDAETLARALLTCVGGIDDAMTTQLATYLSKRGVKDAGQVAGRVMGKLTVYLALIGPVFNGMNYWAETSSDLSAARTVTMFPTVVKAGPPPFDPDSTGQCATPCSVTGSVEFEHPSFGPVTLYTLLPDNPPGAATAVLVDAAGTVRWVLPGTEEERRQYEFSLADPATDSTGLYFINYNPGRYNGITVLKPTSVGMEVIAGWYDRPQGQDLYYASLEGPGSDGRYTVVKSSNDCTPDCASGKTTSVRLRWNGTTFAP